MIIKLSKQKDISMIEIFFSIISSKTTINEYKKVALLIKLDEQCKDILKRRLENSVASSG